MASQVRKTYSLKQASQLLGESDHTLRRRARETGMVTANTPAIVLPSIDPDKAPRYVVSKRLLDAELGIAEEQAS